MIVAQMSITLPLVDVYNVSITKFGGKLFMLPYCIEKDGEWFHNSGASCTQKLSWNAIRARSFTLLELTDGCKDF